MTMLKQTFLKIFHCDVCWRVKIQYKSRIFFGVSVVWAVKSSLAWNGFWLIVCSPYHLLNGRITCNSLP